MEKRAKVAETGLNGSATANGFHRVESTALRHSHTMILTLEECDSRWKGGLAVPVLPLQGKWLLELGWKAGQMARVEADRDSIHIERVDGVEDPPVVPP